MLASRPSIPRKIDYAVFTTPSAWSSIFKVLDSHLSPNRNEYLNDFTALLGLICLLVKRETKLNKAKPNPERTTLICSLGLSQESAAADKEGVHDPYKQPNQRTLPQMPFPEDVLVLAPMPTQTRTADLALQVATREGARASFHPAPECQANATMRSAAMHGANKPAHPNEVDRLGDSALPASQKSAMADGAILQSLPLQIPAAEGRQQANHQALLQ